MDNATFLLMVLLVAIIKITKSKDSDYIIG